MDISDWIAFGALLISIITLIYTFLFNGKTRKLTIESADNALKIAKAANTTAENANKVSHGSLEMSLNNSINESKSRVNRAALELDDFKVKNPNSDSSLREKIFFAELESSMNSYENLCSLYLDGKVDKERCKKNYRTEIRRLVEESKTKDRYFNPAHTSRYKAILKVYDEWENLEK